MEEKNYGEKEMLTDLLCSQKKLACAYNEARLESASPAVLACFEEISDDEHRIQRGVFNMMHERGLYPTPCADGQKIEEAKKTFACGVSPTATV